MVENRFAGDSFGEWLKRRRKAAGLTQEQLALQISCSTSALKKMEANVRRPSAQMAEQLSKIFNIPQKEQTAFLRFARGNGQYASPEVVEDAPWRDATNFSPANLPFQLSSFVGRSKELLDIAGLIASNRLTTLVGPGGMGKTRLSLNIGEQVLRDYAHGVWFVELAPIADALLLPRTVAIALGLSDEPQRPVIDMLSDYLHRKNMLLILDNCEHLVDACAQIADILLKKCPHLKILATSREALNIVGEAVYQVPSLQVPNMQQLVEDFRNYESVRLFEERARLAKTDFSLTAENTIPIAQICTRLDGIPLAIELAAARVNLFSIEQIATQLQESLALLTGGSRTALPRHQTLQAAIDWSYDLLLPREQIFFQRLSVFVNGWTLEAAQAVASDEKIKSEAIVDLLAQLIKKSLVHTKEQQGTTRYQMLETIRQYACEKLRASGDSEATQDRHLAYFVRLAERAEPYLRGFEMVMWLDQFESELDNLRAALRWAQETEVEAQLRLASALLWFWHIRGHRYEGIDWLEQGLSIEVMERGDGSITSSRAMIRGKALNASGELMGESSIGKAAERFEESLELFKQLGTPGKHGMAFALNGLARWTDTKTRKAMQEQSLILFRDVGDKFGAAECLMPLAAYARLEGDFARARALGKEQLALYNEIGDRDGVAIAHAELGNTSLVEGDYQQAMKLYERSLAGFREVGNKWGIVLVLSCLSIAEKGLGNHEQATRTLEEALAMAQALGDKSLIADRLDDLGKVAWVQGDYELAANRYKEELGMSREAENKDATASALLGLGRVAQSQENLAAAHSFYSEAIMVARETGKAWIVAKHLAALANLILAQKQPEKAARVFGAIENLVPYIGLEMSIEERAEYERARIATYGALGEETLAVALAKGQALTMEQAIAYAFEDSGG